MSCTFSQKITVGDYGTTIRFTLKSKGAAFSLLNSTAISIEVKNSAGTQSWIPQTIGDPQYGVIEYVLAPGNINVSGPYVLQPKVTFSGSLFHGSPVTLIVRDAFSN
jgi:hypothetical protein